MSVFRYFVIQSRFNTLESAGSLPDRLFGSVQYFLKEVNILDSVEKILSILVRNTTKVLSKDGKYGFASLNRWNAMEIGQEVFTIDYAPSLHEKKCVRYEWRSIARGDFIKQRIQFSPRNERGEEHICDTIISALRELFVEKMGFEEGKVKKSRYDKE